MGLMELPRGCDYWKDERMISLIEGTVNHVQDFDGCMHGLRAEHSVSKNPIKKPWRIISWGVKIDGLNRKCDGSHEHDKCEGKDTKLTQLYTSQIVGTIYRAITKRVQRTVENKWMSTPVNAEEMSEFSESPRSHRHRLRISKVSPPCISIFPRYLSRTPGSHRLRSSLIGAPGQYEVVCKRTPDAYL